MGQYKVVYNSVMLAMERGEVVQSFARLFSIAPEKAAAILDKPKTVLRSQLNAHEAEIWREKLLAIGIDVDVVDATQPQVGRAVRSAYNELPAVALALAPQPEVGAPEEDSVSRRYGNQEAGFLFSGSGLGYFRLWIANLLLNVLTLGIYSPWAKVRAQQYFYGNTQLAGASFQCLSQPGRILVWRLVFLGLLAGGAALQYVSVAAGKVAAGVLLLLMPALLVFALSVRRDCSAWCRAGFGFEAELRSAYAAAMWLLVPLLGVLVASTQQDKTVMALAMCACALLLPYGVYAITRHVVTHSKFGNRFFGFSAQPVDYYKLLFLKLPLLSVLPGAVLAVVGQEQALAPLGLLAAVRSGQTPQWAAVLPGCLPGGLMAVAVLVVVACWQAQQFNLRYHGLSLGKSYVISDMRTLPLLWLWLGNIAAIVLTAGLFVPWARVRMLRYRLSCLSVYVSYDLDDIIKEARNGAMMQSAR